VVVAALFRLYPGFVFFQAEDGIRDRNVTGVQTCALPIFILRLADGTIAHVELTWAGDDSRSSFELSGDGGMLQYDSGSSAPIQVDRFSETGMIPASDTVLNEPVLKRQLNDAVTNAVSKNASDGLDHYTYAMEIVKAVTESVQ